MYRMVKKPQSGDTIQCVRKRVRGNDARIQESDLFYDKSDGKYYSHMRELGFQRDCPIYHDEYQAYSKNAAKDRSSHTIFLAELADKTAYIKSPRLQESAKSPQQPGYTRGTPRYSGVLVSAGIEEIAPPPVVRLYSEAEMTHASTLTKRMNSPARYHAFRKIGYRDLPDIIHPGLSSPLIKATEFDDRKQVMARYSSSQKSSSEKTKDAFMTGRLLAAEHRQRFEHPNGVLENDRNRFETELFNKVIAELCSGRDGAPEDGEWNTIKEEIRIRARAVLVRAGVRVPEDNPDAANTPAKVILNGLKKGYLAVSQGWPAQKQAMNDREQLPALEVSYGGRTGDMTAEHTPHTPQRQYDLIQSTFFWLPGVDSLGNARAILSFFDVQHLKLKPGGIIRFVGFSDNGNETQDGWQEKQNQYEKAADWVCEHLKRRAYYTDVRKTLLRTRQGEGQAEKKPYSEELSALGLNPKRAGVPLYRPLWTDTNKIVGAGGANHSNLILQARKRRIFRV